MVEIFFNSLFLGTSKLKILSSEKITATHWWSRFLPDQWKKWHFRVNNQTSKELNFVLLHWLIEYAFSVYEKEHMSRSFFSSKVLISLDNTFSWLFLLVCFDTKPLFLKVKKVKKRCSAGHRNLLLHTSSFKKPKQFGFYISKVFLLYRTSSIHFDWLQSQNILQTNVE